MRFVPTEDYERFESALAAYADFLREGQGGLPIYLRDICKQIGVAVVRDPGTTNGKSYLKWDRAGRGKPTILLPADANPRWDRFLAAHEIAHFFLISEFNWIPNSQKSYWKTEGLCNDFARRLLIPPDLVSEYKKERTASGRIMYSKSRLIAKRADVPWTQLSIALTEANCHYAYLKLEKNSVSGDWIIAHTSYPGRAGIRSRISKDCIASKVINLEESNVYNSDKSITESLSIDDFKGSQIRSVFRKFRATSLDLMFFAGSSMGYVAVKHA